MKGLVALFALTIALVSMPAMAQSQCERPSMIRVPDGAASTLDDMLAAQSSVRDFLGSMEAYLDCMNEQIEDTDGDDEQSVAMHARLVDQYNSGVTEMETVAAQFNEERVAYQEANPSQ